METLYTSRYMQNTNWLGRTTEWTREENNRFESALAIFGEHEPDRWFKVAAMIPGKTVNDVIKQYKELEDDVTAIEAGRFPVPGYPCSSFRLELLDNRDFDAYRKRPLAVRSVDHERKKGVPWTEEEHRLFLLGLLKHGKGDWRNISRNFVFSKTPTQVASHAQKYFLRQQLSGVKDKRRPSIHDITIVNLTKFACTDGHKPQTPDQSDGFSSLTCPDNIHKVMNDWNNAKDELLYDSTGGNVSMSSPYEIASNDLIIPGKNVCGGARINPHNLVFQMPSTSHRSVHG